MSALITGLDHVVIAVRDLGRAVAGYEMLLGRGARVLGEADGVATTMLATDNFAVELMSPVGEGEGARRLRAAIENGGEGLKSLVFATSDIARMHRRTERVGLAPELIKTTAQGKSFRVGTERTHGVRIFFSARAAPLAPAPAIDAAVCGLDHVVVRSADAERAAALYGARLGLDMRLDREIAGRRMMFFRCGETVVEVACDATMTGGADMLWGLSWRVSNAETARARLALAGRDVSELRPGQKPGTRVFTVHDGTCGAPTLMIEPGRKPD